jgi:hypothetical protein
MKKYLVILLGSVLMSCSDGDVIVTTFDFDNSALQFCGGPGGYLFFKINEVGSESLSVRFGETEQLFLESDTLDISLNGTANYVNYRIYSGQIDSEYFCNEVPPTTPSVSDQYLGDSGVVNLITITELNDNDGLGANVEGTQDSDGDGLLDYFDFDDDGDNVPTLLELDTANTDGDNNPLTNPKDTDKDGIPDYLDEDDDNDGVLTRYEDANGDLDPTNDIGDINVGGNYLNPSISESTTIDLYREHNYDFSSNVKVKLKNLVLRNGDEQITKETLNLGVFDNIVSGTFLVIPPFN